MAGFGILRNTKHELFCQAIVKGKTREEAYRAAGYTNKHAQHAANLLMHRPEVKARLDELFTSAANRAELSRKQILDRIFEDWEMARKLGQMPAALKAAEMMGKEMWRMFVDRKEIGGPGDFDTKSEAELKQIITDGLRDLGWNEQDLQSVQGNKTTH